MVTAAKDGREYYTRAKLDDKINNQKVRVYQDGCFVHRKWESVRVGDIVELDLNDVIPGLATILFLKYLMHKKSTVYSHELYFGET